MITDIDPTQDICDLLSGMLRYSPAQRVAFTREVLEWITSDVQRDLPPRAEQARLLLAMVPQSIDAVLDLLSEIPTRANSAIHFSLFCAMSELSMCENVADEQQRFVESVPKLVVEYLRRVPVNTGHAAWMAADLLGDHWFPDIATASLEEVVLTGRYVEGRNCGIYGITMLLRRVSATEQNELIQLLERVSRHDRSRDVRSTADWALRRWLTREV